MSDLAIKVEHVSKEYRLGAIGGGTLRGDLQTWMAKIQGREDPNSKIGASSSTRIGERFLALEDVSFSVRKGEALGIIGHNGAGKSTLLKLLCRVTAPTKGALYYNGKIASMLEVGTGFHQELTGRENVYMNGAILGMTRAEISRKFDEIVQFAEMRQFIDTPVKRYSSGMYVKLAFAVAAHLNSNIMIMDEVLAVGDVRFQKKCIERMRISATEEGKTVLYVSHNMKTIRELCNRSIVLDHGKVVYDGDVEKAIEVYTGVNDEFKTRNVYPGNSHLRGARLQVQIDEILFEEGFTGQCHENEKVSLIIEGQSVKDFDYVKIHFEIETSNGSIVGSMFADKVVSVRNGKRFSLPMELDLTGLAPSRYIFHVAIDTLESYESYAWQDTVFHAFVLEVVADAGVGTMSMWNTKMWGPVRLNQVTVK